MSARLPLAIETGGLLLPETGVLSVLHPVTGYDLSGLPKERVQVVQPIKPDHDHFLAQGYDCEPYAGDACAFAVVCVPRAKARARGLIAIASERSAGVVVVDGTKTDGIDSLLKEIRKRVDVHGPLSKAHGKIFWFHAEPGVFDDWKSVDQTVDGYVTAPGVFSADGVDPASLMLAQVLPSNLGRHVIDLGAGWGYLSAQVLADSTVQRIDLVEADAHALDCARQNMSDPRASFHWADATEWSPREKADTVIMNPPFHSGRKADPALGQEFVSAAARMLSPSGQLWMVANRHLPYERTLEECFAQVNEVAGDNRFKIFHASKPKGASRPSPLRSRR